MSSQKYKAVKARRTSLKANLARCLIFDDDDDDDDCGVEFLVAEWDRESSLGVEMGEREGNVGDRGVSVGLVYFLVVRVE